MTSTRSGLYPARCATRGSGRSNTGSSIASSTHCSMLTNFPPSRQRLRLFSLDRFNLFSLRAADHGPDDGSSLRAWAERLLADTGVDLEGGRIELLSFPRVLGYVFNPISVWYCYGPDDRLRAVLHEVRNTFGDKHTYVVPIHPNRLRHGFDKQLHVSPFMDVDGTYEFTINAPGDRIAVGINQQDAEGPLFRAGLSLSRRSLTDRNLLRVFFTHPLVTLKAITAIHWEALKLWRKGARYRPRPLPAAQPVSVGSILEET